MTQKGAQNLVLGSREFRLIQMHSARSVGRCDHFDLEFIKLPFSSVGLETDIGTRGETPPGPGSGHVKQKSTYIEQRLLSVKSEFIVLVMLKRNGN
jgi:hypothetical protein